MRRRPLRPGEIAELFGRGQMIGSAAGARRRKLQADAVNRAQRLHSEGVPWRAIATALGIAPETLRRWRMTRTSKPTALPVPEPRYSPEGSQTLPFSASFPAETLSGRQAEESYYILNSQTSSAFMLDSRLVLAATSYQRLEDQGTKTHSSQNRGVLIVLGHPNSVAGEWEVNPASDASSIRHTLAPANIVPQEKSHAELLEIRGWIEFEKPTVLHVAAHAEVGSSHPGTWMGAA